MQAHSQEAQPSVVEPDERSPLLPNNTPSKSRDNGPIEQQSPRREGPEQDEGATQVADDLSTAKLSIIMGSMWIGVFLNALDGTIVATLSAPISGEFQSGTLFSWLASAYLISNAAIQPLSGKLTDIFGRRAGLIWSHVFFLAGNLVCGLAKDEWVIILGRVIAGIGGGCLNTISTFVGSDLVPLRQRGLWQGFGNVAFGLGAGTGGVFGGWINDVWSWRWAFLIQAPFVLVSGCIVAYTVRIPVKVTDKSRLSRVDFPGAFTLVASLVLLLLGLNSGGNIVPWSHPLVYVSLLLSLVLLAIFVYIEDKVAEEPVIPVRLLLDRTVAAACLTNWFTTMGYFGFLFYAPMYFEARGLSTSAAGARLIPSSLGSSIGSLSTGFIMKATGKYHALSAASLSTLVAGMSLLLAFLDESLPAWEPFIIFFLNGVGYGGMLTITLLALISAVEHDRQAVITSASYAFRSTGSTIGIAVAGAVFQNVLKERLQQELGGTKDGAKYIVRLRDSIGAIKQIPGFLRHAAELAYINSLRSVWVATLGLCVLGAATGFLMRENTLYSTISRR